MRKLVRLTLIIVCCTSSIASSITQSAFDSTSFSVLQEITERLKRGNPSPELGDALYALSTQSLIRNENIDESIGNMLEAIQVFYQIGDSSRAFDLRRELSMLYMSEHYPREALSHLNSALSHYRKADDKLNIGVTLNFIADNNLVLGETDTAVHYVRQARTIAQQTDDSLITHLNRTTITSLNRAGVAVEGITDTSEVMLDKTRSLPQDYYSLALINSGYYHFMNDHRDAARYYFKRAIDSADTGSELLKDAYMRMSLLSETSGDTIQAFRYLQMYTRLNDSLLNERRQNIIDRLKFSQSALEQKAKISQLEKDRNIAAIQNRLQRILNFSLLFGSVIVLLGAYFTIRNYQHRLNSNQIILKQNEEINKSRINELENNLKIETMQSMIMGQEAERERIAKDLHDSLGGLLSTVKLHFDAIQSRNHDVKDMVEYNKANDLLDEACKEVRNISNNMQPGTLMSMGVVPAINDLINRVQSEDTALIDFQHFGMEEDNLHQTVELNIFRIVQELLNNSLKHANASHILVQLIRKDDEIMVMVEDDGVGYDSDSVETGMGTGNIASRVNFLKGDLSIHSVIGEGTSTLINIPLN